MRFIPLTVALLALARSVAPGVHGAPAVVLDHANSLAGRQDALVSTLLAQLLSTIQSLFVGSPNAQVSETLAQEILQRLQGSIGASSSILPRAISPTSDPTFSASSASLTTLSPTTTSTGLVVSPQDVDTSASSGSNSLTVPLSPAQTSLSPPTRMRRQTPPSVPTPVPATTDSVASPSASKPAPSVPAASLISGVLSKLASGTSKPVPGPPAPSTLSVRHAQV